MEQIFRDVAVKTLLGWAGILLATISSVIWFVYPAPSVLAKVGLAVAFLVGLSAYLVPYIYAAIRAGHKHIPTVFVWSFFLVATFLVCVYYCYFQAFGSESRYDKVLLLIPVVPAMWAAGLGWFIHYQLTAKAHRTNNSFSIIMEMRKSAEYLRRQAIVTKHFPPGIPVCEDYRAYFDHRKQSNLHFRKLADPTSVSATEDDRAEAMDSLKYMVNYFEFMSAGVEAKDLDCDLLYETISPVVVGIHDRAKIYIDYVNSTVGANEPLAFQHLKKLAESWDEKLDLEAAAFKAKAKK